MTTTARYKIGTNKGKRRIWIDGRKLAEAGFTPGTTYHCYAEPGRIVLSIEHLMGMGDGRTRKVSGRPDGKPIVDMLGRDVERAFPSAAAVIAAFWDGHVSLTPEPARTEWKDAACDYAKQEARTLKCAWGDNFY
jgi:DNA (cytosine-5)-methyltransferase 1